MVEIISNLFISNWAGANDNNLLHTNNICFIVNASMGSNGRTQKLTADKSICRLEVFIDDYDTSNISEWFPKVNRFIHNNRKKGPVLVHCIAGQSRSPCLVVAYLMSKQNLSLHIALALVAEKIPILDINEGFMGQLRQLKT